jgi:hypothetical protein
VLVYKESGDETRKRLAKMPTVMANDMIAEREDS